MATVVVKSYLEMPDLSVETRRFVVERSTIDLDGIYDQVHGKVGNTFPGLNDKKFSLFWKDDDDDFITVSTDEEIRDLMSNGVNGICRIYIKVNQDESSNESASQDKSLPKAERKGNHEKTDMMESDKTPQFPQHIGGHGFFSHPFGFHGPPHPFGPFSGQPFGGPWGGRRGGGRHHHHGGFYGHHFGHQGHHHWHGHGHHHGGHGGHHFHGGMHAGQQEWKDSLRSLVPMPHRRWAEGFIQIWRKENLKNATTTTSDSDGNADWKVTMEKAGVPLAYAEWLKVKLIRWHKKWCSDETGDVNVEVEPSKMEKKTKKALKASVPLEFRQWIKRYLNTHYGKRDAPAFKNRHGGCNEGDKWANKKRCLNAMIPKEQRKWTKEFIRTWRIEKKLDDPNTTIPSPNNSSDDYETDMHAVESASVPKEYQQWLEKFLLRWHTWRGQLERNPDMTTMRGGMGQFKDTVPMEYRGWVKNYMCTHYAKHNKKSERCREIGVDPSQRKYAKMMLAFQKQWVQNQQQLGEDSDPLLYMSSSEEETTADKGEPEASFERLTIESDGGSRKTKVRFDDNNEAGKNKKQKKVRMEDLYLLVDSDHDDDDMTPKRKVPMNPNFRHWAKQALSEWDGKTTNTQQPDKDGEEEEVNLPPHVYQWMSKMMMKMEMKKMKQQFKAAKREMKAAKKQQKFGMN